MSEFTPGPWKTAAPHEYIVYEDNTKEKLIITREVDGYTEEEQLANARLIAAAPKMYKILKTLYEGPAPIAPAVYDPRFEKFYLAWMEMKELVKRIDGEEQED